MIKPHPQINVAGFGVLLPGLLLSACLATTDQVASAQVNSPAGRLSALMELDRRTTKVAFNLSVANLDLCPDVGPKVGWRLHAASQYNDGLRLEAERVYGLQGALPGVSVVVSGSPAEVAGLQVGDLITAVDGKPLDVGHLRIPADYADLEKNLAHLDAAALDDGIVSLIVLRQGKTLSMDVVPVPACAYETQVDPSRAIWARADGKRVFISSAFAAYAATDADLAFVLGHELAHNVLDHPRRMKALGMAPWRSQDMETAADRVGLFLAARAGYDVRPVPSFLLRLSQDYWQLRYPQWGHASAGSRARSLDMIVAEIETRRARGMALTP